MRSSRCHDCQADEALHEEIESALDPAALDDDERAELARLALVQPAAPERVGRRRLFLVLPLAAAAAVVLVATLTSDREPMPETAAVSTTVDRERAANLAYYLAHRPPSVATKPPLYQAIAGGRSAGISSDPAELDRGSRIRVPGAVHRFLFRTDSPWVLTLGPDSPEPVRDPESLDPLYEVPGWAVGKTGRGPTAWRRYLLPNGEGGYREVVGWPGKEPPPLWLGGRPWLHAGPAVNERALEEGRPLLELRGDSTRAPLDLLESPSLKGWLENFVPSYFFFEHEIRAEAEGLSLHLDPAPRLVVLTKTPPGPGAPVRYRVREGVALYDRAELILDADAAVEHVAAFLRDFGPAPVADWVAVPAGPYLSGPTGRATQRTLPAYEIQRHEVTNLDWWKYLASEENRLKAQGKWAGSVPWTWGYEGAGGSPVCPPGKLDLPVASITWYQANDYCVNYLATLPGFEGARLPTAEEWEKAARGAEDDRPWPWGYEFLHRPVDGREVPRANTLEARVGGPAPVDRYRGDVSPYGVIGMGGNVAEFVGDPVSLAIMGGTFSTDKIDAQVFLSTPVAVGSDHCWTYVGFRAARTPR